MIKKIYIVTDGWYADFPASGVFTKRELAEERVLEIQNTLNLAGYDYRVKDVSVLELDIDA